MTWRKRKIEELTVKRQEISDLEKAINEYRHEISYYQDVLANSQDLMIHMNVTDPEWNKQIKVQKNASDKIALYNRLEKDLHKRVDELRDELS